jgi:hypothetical protein
MQALRRLEGLQTEMMGGFRLQAEQ